MISAASLSWSLGSFLQARLDRRDGGAGRPRRLLAGLAVLLAGIAATAAGVRRRRASRSPSRSPAGRSPGSASASATRRSARSSSRRRRGGEEGGVSAALQLIETIGVAVFTGLGGALIALGIAEGWDTVTALAVVFAAGAAAAVAGLAAGRRVVVA